MGEVRQDFAHRYATTLAGQMGIKAHNYRRCQSRHEVIRTLINARWNAIWRHVEEDRDSTVARLARCGLGNFPEHAGRVKMADVHRTEDGGMLPWMNLDWTGSNMLTQVATTALVAAMAENLWEELEKQRARDAHFEHTSEFRDELPKRGFGKGMDAY